MLSIFCVRLMPDWMLGLESNIVVAQDRSLCWVTSNLVTRIALMQHECTMFRCVNADLLGLTIFEEDYAHGLFWSLL